MLSRPVLQQVRFCSVYELARVTLTFINKIPTPSNPPCVSKVTGCQLPPLN